MNTEEILLYLANGIEEDVPKVKKAMQEELNDMYTSFMIENSSEYLNAVESEKDVPTPEEWIRHFMTKIEEATSDIAKELAEEIKLNVSDPTDRE